MGSIIIGRPGVWLSGGAAPSLLFSDDFATDGALGADWSGATWSIASSKLTNTPSLGSELLVNGNMETGNPPTGWNAGTGATLTGVADERTGGSGAQSLNVERGSNFSAANKSTGSGQVEWHRVEAWLKNVDATEAYLLASGGESQHENSTDWVKAIMTKRLAAASAITFVLRIEDGSGDEVRLDDVSIKKITRSSLFATVDGGRSNINLSAPRLSTYRPGTQSGIVCCADDAANPANFVIAYLFDQVGAGPQLVVIEECVAGAYNVLASVSISHSQTKHFSAKVIGNQLYVYYGTDDYGTLVGGAPVTINAALVNNTRHGLFSTSETNVFTGRFMLWSYYP